jgi:excisionase family DNA binding protein
MLSVKEVAGRLGVSEQTVLKLIERGELATSRVGRQYRVAEADLAAYLERTKVRPAAH